LRVARLVSACVRNGTSLAFVCTPLTERAAIDAINETQWRR
jgi:hypothetical protein